MTAYVQVAIIDADTITAHHRPDGASAYVAIGDTEAVLITGAPGQLLRLANALIDAEHAAAGARAAAQ